jgi:hypothetical protein
LRQTPIKKSDLNGYRGALESTKVVRLGCGTGLNKVRFTLYFRLDTV